MERDYELGRIPLFAWACLLACLILLALSFLDGEALLSLSPVANSQLGRRAAGVFSQAWFGRGLVVLAVLYGLAALLSVSGRVRSWFTQKCAATHLSFTATLLLALILVILFDGPATRVFFFRYDDFEFIGDVLHDSYAQIFGVHGDTGNPGLRFLFALFWNWFGAEPLGWSLLIRGLLLGILVSGMWVIREFRGGRIPQISFLLLCGGWAGWGAYLSAYACISMYMMLIVLALIATGALLRWYRTGEIRSRGAYCVALVLLPFPHLSAAWVYVWIGLLLIALQKGVLFTDSNCTGEEGHPWKATSAWGMLAASFGLLLGLHGYALLTSGRSTEFADASGSGIPALLWRGLVYLLGIPYTLLAPGSFPYFEQHGLSFLFLLCLMGAGILFLVVMCRVLKGEARILVALFGCTLAAIALMVAQGRQAESPYFLWQEKYLAFGFVWFVLLLCILWQYAWRSLLRPGRVGREQQGRWLLQGTAVLLAGYLGMQVGVDLMGAHARHLHVGRRYWAGISEETRAAIASLRAAFSPMVASGDTVAFPTLPTDHLQASHPVLGPYDLSDVAPFVFPDLGAVRLLSTRGILDRRGSNVVEADDLRQETSPVFLDALRTSLALRDLYLQMLPSRVDVRPWGREPKPVDVSTVPMGEGKEISAVSIGGEGLRFFLDGGAVGGILRITFASADGLPPSMVEIGVEPGLHELRVPVSRFLAWSLRGEGRRVIVAFSKP